jgi:hypothetical protein
VSSLRPCSGPLNPNPNLYNPLWSFLAPIMLIGISFEARGRKVITRKQIVRIFSRMIHFFCLAKGYLWSKFHEIL